MKEQLYTFEIAFRSAVHDARTINDLRAQLAAVRKEVARKEEDLNGWKAESDTLHLQLANMKAKLGAADRDLQDVASEADRLRHELAVATKELAAVPVRLKFKVGDRVASECGSLGVVSDVGGYYVKWPSGPSWVTEANLEPAPELQPETQWHGCTADEARWLHAHENKRVRCGNWTPDVWIHNGDVVSKRGLDAAWRLRQLTVDNGDWCWADPLPKGGT